MHALLIKAYCFAGTLSSDQEAQNLVEYALIVGCMAFACVAGMQSLASGLTVAFNNMSGGLAAAV